MSPLKRFLLAVAPLTLAVSMIATAAFAGDGRSGEAAVCRNGSLAELEAAATTSDAKSVGVTINVSDKVENVAKMKAFLEEKFPKFKGHPQVEEEWTRTTKVAVLGGPKGIIIEMLDKDDCIVDYVPFVGENRIDNAPKLQHFTPSAGA